jgi:long-chain acyl-CoA synthetase
MATLEHTAEERSTHASSLGQMFVRAASRAEDPALQWYEGGRWVEMSYGELGARVRAIARGLIALGIEPGDRVAILSNTRPEWTLVDGGVLCAGASTAPIYQTNSPEECEYVLRHSEARLVFCEDAEQLAKIALVRTRCPQLERAVLMTPGGHGAMSLDELCAAGEEVPPEAVDERVAHVRPDELATLIYTSGTTGPPKACTLIQSNWTEMMHMYERVLDLEQPPVVCFMFLPLAHSYARMVQMVTLDVGGTLAYWRRDPNRILEDIQAVNPTHLSTVPRVFEKIYTAATAGVAEAPALKRAIFKWSIATGRRAGASGRYGVRYRIADRLVLSKVRGLFGNRMRLAASAAAPIARDVLEFFDACGVPVVEGWGMSETTAAGTINTLHDRKLGTIGRPLPGCEIRIADDGEILVRGPQVLKDYYKDPDATSEALDGTWLRTGDMGSIDADGYVTISGRKKEIIITSSGKNISPANIENALKESRWISEAVVYGDDRPYLVAVITLDPEEVPALAEKVGMEPDVAAMAGDERVRAVIQHEVDATNSRFARIEQVKRFQILDHDLSQATGEMTPTLKVKRRVVYRKYADLFDRLYA